MTDQRTKSEERDLLQQRIEESGLKTAAFARRVLLREPRTVRRWLAGDSPIPNRVKEWLEAPMPAPWPLGEEKELGCRSLAENRLAAEEDGTRMIRHVTLTLRLPPDIADQAEEVHAAEPAFLERAVLYGLTRRSIYRHLRGEGTTDGLVSPDDDLQPIPEEEGRAILDEREHHDPGAGYSGYDETILRTGEP